MSADSIRMGRAHVEIGGDDSPLKRVLRSVGQQIQATGQRIRGIGASMLGAGLSGATALGGASLAFGAMGDDMAKMATRTGVAVEALSELRFVAERSGASASDLEGGLRFMGRFLGGVITPDKIQFAPGLPKTRSGKIMRRLLKDVAECRDIGDTTTLADSSVMNLIKETLGG